MKNIHREDSMVVDPYKSKPQGWRGEVLPIFKEEWSARARVAASFIPPESRVLDLGCGAGLLRDLLPQGCSWVGYDLRPLHSEIRPIDLDSGDFPHGSHDYVVLLGVLDWLGSPGSLLKKARLSAANLIASDKYRHWSWRNPVRKGASLLEHVLPGTGWSISTSVGWGSDAKHFYSVCHLV
jgi:SAM-dependent methyltransferase